MPIDTNPFQNLHTFEDYRKADQAFQLQKAQQIQQMQGGAIDQQAKQLSLAGQIIGNSSVDQSSYDQSRQAAQKMGIDTSFLPDQFNPDVVNRLRFAGATPTAQLSALIASQGHQLKAGIAGGDIGAYGYGNNSGIGVTSPASNNAPIASPQSNAPRGNGNMSSADQNAAITDLYGNQPSPDNAMPNPIANTPAPANSQATPQFSFRAQNAGETINAYKAAQQQAFDQFKTNNAPAIKQAESKASKLGELAATNEEGAKQAQEMTGRLNQNLDALEKIIPDLPTSEYANPDTKAWLDKRNPLSDHKAATAYSQFQEINQQQMINGLSELVKSGQIRGNQFIEKIISRGYMINPDDPKDAQLADIKNLKAELGNIKISAGNLAGGNQPYQAIPVQTSQPALPQGAALYGTSNGKNVYKLPDGSFIMEQ